MTALLLAACTNDEIVDDNALPESKYPLEIGSVTISGEGDVQPWGANSIGAGNGGGCGTVTIKAGVTVNGRKYMQDVTGEVK